MSVSSRSENHPFSSQYIPPRDNYFASCQMEWTIRCGITRAPVLTCSAKHCSGTAFLVHTSRLVRADATFYLTTARLFLSTPVAAFVNE